MPKKVWKAQRIGKENIKLCLNLVYCLYITFITLKKKKKEKQFF